MFENFFAQDPKRFLLDRRNDGHLGPHADVPFRALKPVVLKYLEAAEELSIPLDELMHLIETGELRTTRITRRERGISLTEISRYRSIRLKRLPASVSLALALAQPLPLTLKK